MEKLPNKPQSGAVKTRGRKARVAISLLLAFVVCNPLAAQPPPPVGCNITGTNPATGSCTYTYTLNGGCSAVSWTVSCGTIQSSTSTTCTVFFNNLTCGTSTIKAWNGSGGTGTTLATLNVTENSPPALSGGTISNTSQTINYNTTPSQINASAASGGGCLSISYQWYYSTDGGVTYNPVSGATAQNYQPSALTTTTYYKRWVSNSASSAWTSNVAIVTVCPQVLGGTITPSIQYINYGATPSLLSSSGASGGCGACTFQWMSSPDQITWTDISGADSSTYQPPSLTSTTYYELEYTCNGVTAYSYSTEVVVYPQVVGGSISPSPQTINYNTVPSSLSLSGWGGGNLSYTYQWDSSKDNSTWSVMPGQTGTGYSPPALTSTTYYRVTVTSNGASANSATAVINVYPQLVAGSITPAPQTIKYGTKPDSLYLTGTSGGNGTYTYVWKACATSNGVFTQVGTAGGYAPGILTATTWYEVVVTSNGVSVTSGPVPVYVNGQFLAGNLVPYSLTLASGTDPGLLTANPASGDSCSGSYYYQWQSSTNDTTFSNVSGATNPNYDPGPVSSSVFYRRRAICGTDTVYTNVCQITVGTPASNFSFIRSRNLMKPGVTDTATADGLSSAYDVAQTTQYFDGLGRLVQTVAKQASPLQNDVVVPVIYDNFGRQAVSYLPYTASTADGSYKTTALIDQYNFNAAQYSGEQYYYQETSYEASPLNRVLSGDAQGLSWIGNNTGVSAQYLLNTASDSVQIWSISSTQLATPVDNGAYAAGQLYKQVGADEQGHQVISYIDKLGKTILKKVQQASSPSPGPTGWLNTYYIYDTLQNLRVVLQPQAVALISGSWTINSTIANELCFRYEYDGRRRLAIRKAPGAGVNWMVYDARNRLVMTQDSALRSSHKWLFVKYDAQNRPDSTGLVTDPTNYNNLAYHDTLAYYSTNYPTVSSYANELLTQTFYDDYSWISTYSAPVGATMATTYTSNSSYFITTYNTSPTYAVQITPSYITRGMPTGGMKKVVGTSSQYLYSVSFFDDRGRTIQTQSVNYTGAVDTVTMQYNFSGVPLRQLVGHKKNNNTVQNHTVLTKLDYDAGLRLRHIWKNIDGAASDQLIDSIQYDELGRVRARYLGNAVDSLIYSYNIRSWLTGINKNYVAGSQTNYFGMELGYDKTGSAAPGNTYANPQVNGNVGGVVWKSAGSGVNRKYDFTYDNANRLTAANFGQYNGSSFDRSAGIDYSVTGLSYDADGNILTMTQRGFTVGGSSAIDSLTYTYLHNDSSNRLQQVMDAANNPSTLLGDFHYASGKGAGTDYAYDGNGNMIQDNNKAIDSITYNYLSLPQQVHMNGKGYIKYVYDASGTRLAKITTDSLVRHSTTTLYIGGFVYQQNDTITNPGGGTDTLQFVLHEEGRTRWAYHKYTNGTAAYKFEYDFFEKDHLGNTRMVLTQQHDTTNYLASMEAAYRTTESALFGNIAATSYLRSSVTGYPNDHAYTNPNDSVAKVDYNGTSGNTSGPNLLLKVMSGDTIRMLVQSYYNSGAGGTNNSSFTDVLNSLAGGLVNATGGAHGTLSNLTTSGSSVYTGLTSFLNSNDSTPASYPKAYLNWIFLDDQFNYVSSLSGAVLATSSTYPAGQLNTVAPGSQLPITRNGYLFVWVSNETQGWDVFFDNLFVQHKQGPLLEENHYYPFGLSMAGVSDKALKTQYAENKFRFNGKELQHQEFSDGTGLEMYDYGARMLDPQLGTWHNIDPLADLNWGMTPYVYAVDNPILYTDPNGMKQVPITNYSAGTQVYLNNLADPGNHQLQWAQDFANASTWSFPSGGGDGDSDAGGGNGNGGGDGDGVSGPFTGPYADFWNSVWNATPDDKSRTYTLDALGNVTQILFDYTCTTCDATFEAPAYHEQTTHQDGDWYSFTGTSTKLLSEIPAFHSSGGGEESDGLEMAKATLDAAIFAQDLTKNGIVGAQVLANATAGTSYPILNLGKVNLLKAGKLGTLSVETVGRGLGVAAVGLTLFDIHNNGLNWSNGTDLVFDGVAFIPGIGWVISGTYFIANTIVTYETGESIGQHIGNKLNSTPTSVIQASAQAMGSLP